MIITNILLTALKWAIHFGVINYNETETIDNKNVESEPLTNLRVYSSAEFKR